MIARFLQTKEDSLTASVFGHLLHLPIETFWQILKAACYGDELPGHCGEPALIAPWPKWSAEGTDNSRYIEPDLFLRFQDFDLIIEAKRWDEGMQSHRQWRQELIAYENEYGGDGKQVHFLALGGLLKPTAEMFKYSLSVSQATVEAKTCLIHKAKWSRLLLQCQRMHSELDRQSYVSSQSQASKRLLANLIDLFAAHGFSTGRWYADFDFSRNRPAYSQTGQSLLTSRIQHLSQ